MAQLNFTKLLPMIDESRAAVLIFQMVPHQEPVNLIEKKHPNFERL